MIGRTNAGGGGGGRATVTLIAPAGSTVSWTGAESGSVSMGSHTQASVALKKGTYSFRNTLSVRGTNTEIFSKAAAVAGDTTVRVMPERVVYWYGMGDVSFVKTSNSTVTTKDIYIQSTADRRSNEGLRTSSQVSIAGATKLLARVYSYGSIPTGNGAPQTRLWTSDTSGSWTTESGGSRGIADTMTEIQSTISGSGAAYVGVNFTPTAYSSTTVEMYALWLE